MCELSRKFFLVPPYIMHSLILHHRTIGINFSRNCGDDSVMVCQLWYTQLGASCWEMVIGNVVLSNDFERLFKYFPEFDSLVCYEYTNVTPIIIIISSTEIFSPNRLWIAKSVQSFAVCTI